MLGTLRMRGVLNILLSAVTVYAVILLLVFRPTGLLGSTAREKV